MRIGVVGCGIFGLAAALELQRRGHLVTALDQGTIPYERASSTDVSKTIRRLYGRNETYVELAERAAAQWRHWHTQLGQAIYYEVGQFHIVSNFEPGTRLYESWRVLEGRDPRPHILSLRDACARFPQFRYQPDDVCFYDAWGGYVASDAAMTGLLALARAQGVLIKEGKPITHVEDSPNGAYVVSNGTAEEFDCAIVATGVWLGELIRSLREHITVTRQQMVFVEPRDPRPFAPGTLPAWATDSDTEGWYGHPLLRHGVVKIANDLRRDIVPANIDRSVTDDFIASVQVFLSVRIPALSHGRIAGGRACLYENTPDRHFIIDRAPGQRRVFVAGGGSGHGFKFGGSIGAVIADAVEDKPNRLGDLFRIGDRFNGSD